MAGRRYDFTLVLPRAESRETMARLMREGIEAFPGDARDRSMEAMFTSPRGIDAPRYATIALRRRVFRVFLVRHVFAGGRRLCRGSPRGIMDLHMAAPEPGSPGGMPVPR
jgi:hypothetical protein